MKRRFLLVVNKGPNPPCEVRPWLEPHREWDYHEMLWHKESERGRFVDRVVRRHAIEPQWRKFQAFKATSLPGWQDYEAVCLADDDVSPVGGWGAIFDAFLSTGMRVGTPALGHGSHVAHAITARTPESRWRETNYLDLMCVLFSRDGLKAHWDTLSAPREPWGIESVWAQRELAEGRAIAILDSTPVTHMRPVNTSADRVAIAMADHDALLKRFRVDRITEHKTLRVHT